MPDSLDAPRPQTQPVRRCATLPTKLNPRKQRSAESLRSSTDDLFYHPCAKVVHFAPRALAPIPSSTAPSDFDYPVDTVETLPWRSPTERTVAFAPLRLENVHGLTVFLKCGGVVHAILKNSQCWCVDGDSTFVLRIRPLTYYRIELPNETENNGQYVVELKSTLPKILRYEITPCPFKRGFTIEIPEEAKIPRRRRAWRPKNRRESAPASSVTVQEQSPAKKKDAVDHSDSVDDVDRNINGSRFRSRGTPSAILETIPDDNESLTPTDVPEPLFLPRRAVSETPQTFQTLLARFESNTESQADTDMSFSSSVESFHSVEGSYTFPESSARSTSTAPSSIDNTELLHDQQFQTQESAESVFKDVDYLAVNDSSDSGYDYASSQALQSPTTRPVEDPEPKSLEIPPRKASTTSTSSLVAPETKNTMSVEFRRRAKASTERELSPMPPPSTLCRSNSSRKPDTKSIIQKTCTVVLVPPVQLLIVLIHIAAQIVIGPALNSAMGDIHRNLEYQASDPQDALDDFDIPLEPSDSQEVRRLDVWELD